MVAITAGAGVTVGACWAAVVRSRDSAYVLHEICSQAMIWVAAGWVIAMGWLVGDVVASTGAVIGVLLATVVVGIAGLVVASRLDTDLTTALRRRGREA